MTALGDPVLQELLDVARVQQALRFIDYVRDRTNGKTAESLANIYPRAKQFEAAYQEGTR